MQTDQPFNFSFALEEARGSEVSGPSHFAAALKQARFRKGWTQAELAAQLSIPKRAVVSWETAERIPSVGSVLILLDALTSEEEFSLDHELFRAYLLDDLERQETRKDQSGALLARVRQVILRIMHLPTKVTASPVIEKRQRAEEASSQVGELFPTAKIQESQTLEPLFALMAQLRQHPELISVARDFIREMVADE